MESELTRFLHERESSYRRLENLLSEAELRGVRHFRQDELIEFGHLYRLAAADLARARYVLRSPLLAEYLNELVGRAHHVIHRRREPFWTGLWRFIRADFARLVRAEAVPILISAVIILGAALLGGIAYSLDPDWGQLVISQPELRQYERDLTGGPSRLASGEIAPTAMPAASAFIITNNIRACAVATAGGLLFGLGTVAALAFNGFLLGVVGAMFLTRGVEYNLYFWAGILPHGVLEIPAVIIAGGAGFVLARGLLIPGTLTRGDALRMEGRSAMKLLGGVVILLVVAGLIEGFITPLHQWWAGNIMKILFAVVLFSALMLYFFRAGKGMEEADTRQKAPRTSTHLRLD